MLVAVGAFVVFYAPHFQNPLKVPQTRQFRLLDVESGRSESTFVCPDALGYTLLLAFPKDRPGSPTGELIFSEGQTNILRINLESASLVNCTWLNRHGLTGFIIELAHSSNDRRLNSYLKGGLQYRIVADNVPVGVSIWLDYMYPSRWDMPLIGKKHRERVGSSNLQSDLGNE
jgi:hypothetical protein